MNPYLQVAGVSPVEMASLLGVDRNLLNDWGTGRQPMPQSMAAHLAAVLGVPEEGLITPPKQPVNVSDVGAPVWFKLRASGLEGADKEVVFLARRLGVFLNELETVLGEPAVSWTAYFNEIRHMTNLDASPGEQGRQAARIFRSYADLAKGKSGIGNMIRSSLRRLGIQVLESPVKGSRIEGCAFMVGPTGGQRPCIFINSYTTNWFRRNELLMHEVAHAVFDLSSAGASLDFVDDTDGSPDIAESRADAFAQEVLVPAEVLNHLANQHGICWENPSAETFARLIAETHVEKRLILKAAVDAGFISEVTSAEMGEIDTWQELKKVSPHALTAAEFLAQAPGHEAEAWLGKRMTTLPSHRLRLPVSYVKTVLEAQQADTISASRAARLLMISEKDYSQRFEPDLADEAEWG